MSEFVSRWASWESGDPESPTREPVALPKASSTDQRQDGEASEDLTASEVTKMRLDDFATAGLIVQVHSEVLGCRVLFVSDDVAEEALAGYEEPVYRASELKKLVKLGSDPRELQRIHMVKDILRGTVRDVQEVDS